MFANETGLQSPGTYIFVYIALFGLLVLMPISELSRSYPRSYLQGALDTKQKFPSHGRKATIRQLYAVILPSLEQLYNTSLDMHNYQGEVHGLDMIVKKKSRNNCKNLEVDSEREEECGICLESCTKIVLPDCCHEMCINCYRDWNMRSESCPFCRGSLKRVNSGDLWVLPCSGDIVDQKSLSKEDVLRFYLYINNLPKDTLAALFSVYYEYLI